jgi:hypothetical protein
VSALLHSIASQIATPFGAALFAICGICIVVAGVLAGAAAGAQDTLAKRIAQRRAERPAPMRTANSGRIERQTRALQQRASSTQP